MYVKLIVLQPVSGYSCVPIAFHGCWNLTTQKNSLTISDTNLLPRQHNKIGNDGKIASHHSPLPNLISMPQLHYSVKNHVAVITSI